MTVQRNEAAQRKPRTLEQYGPLIQKLARRGHARALAVNAPYEEEDLRQEISMVFLKAVEQYDEEAGRSFINYFISGAHMRLNSLIRPHESQLKHASTVSGDSLIRDEDGDASVWGLIEDVAVARPDETAEEESMYRWLLDRQRSKLSESAAAILTMIVDTPPEVEEQYKLWVEGSAYIRNQGGSARAPQQLTLPVLLQILGLSDAEGRKVRHEITNAVRRYTGVSQ